MSEGEGVEAAANEIEKIFYERLGANASPEED